MVFENTRDWYVVQSYHEHRQELAGNCNWVFRDEGKTLILLVILSDEW